MANVNPTVYEDLLNQKPFYDQKSSPEMLLKTKIIESYYKHTDKTLIRKLEIFQNSTLVAMEEYYSNGHRKTYTTYHKGLKNGTEVGYYQNGVLQYEMPHADGKINGKLQSWHSNGNRSYHGYYKHGKEIGKHYSWHKNGALWSEQGYYDGVLDGRSQKWDENGVLKSVDEYRNGESKSSRNNMTDQEGYPQIIEIS